MFSFFTRPTVISSERPENRRTARVHEIATEVFTLKNPSETLEKMVGSRATYTQSDLEWLQAVALRVGEDIVEPILESPEVESEGMSVDQLLNRLDCATLVADSMFSADHDLAHAFVAWDTTGRQTVVGDYLRVSKERRIDAYVLPGPLSQEYNASIFGQFSSRETADCIEYYPLLEDFFTAEGVSHIINLVRIKVESGISFELMDEVIDHADITQFGQDLLDILYILREDLSQGIVETADIHRAFVMYIAERNMRNAASVLEKMGQEEDIDEALERVSTHFYQYVKEDTFSRRAVERVANERGNPNVYLDMMKEQAQGILT